MCVCDKVVCERWCVTTLCVTGRRRRRRRSGIQNQKSCCDVPPTILFGTYPIWRNDVYLIQQLEQGDLGWLTSRPISLGSIGVKAVLFIISCCSLNASISGESGRRSCSTSSTKGTASASHARAMWCRKPTAARARPRKMRVDRNRSQSLEEDWR